MFDISNEGRITLTRGDSFSSPLFINAGTEIRPVRYHLSEDDIVYFAVMEPNRKFECAIIKKVYTHNDLKSEQGDIVISLNPSDTEFLKPGQYYYTVKLRTMQSNEVQTVIPEREFMLLR